MKTIVVALSGGVDSATAAVMAQEAGCKVIGVTLRMREESPENTAVLEEVVSRLGIEHYTLDREEEFCKRVLVPSAEIYARGETPNPCCLCNFCFKFAELLAFTEEVGGDELWTGHYACIDRRSGTSFLCRGTDAQKDQSYFLYRLTGDMLDKVFFPLGKYNKATIRDYAARRGYLFSKKPDSQDVCFAVPGETCGDTLLKAAGLPEHPGKFIYDGRNVGTHTGFHRFTIGQRNGHGVALGKPAYISRIDASTGDIELVTDKEKLGRSSFFLKECNWFTQPEPDKRYQVQIRYRSRSVACRVEKYSEDCWKIYPEMLLYAVTPGQAGVLYQGDTVVGGGIICLPN